MKLRQYGFFRELDHGDENAESLVALRGTANYRDEVRQRIVRYLESGQLYIGCPGTVFDVLAETKGTPIGCPHILTDGDWAWPADLPYYVSRYDVPVPQEMLDGMRRNDWTAPKDIRLAELVL